MASRWEFLAEGTTKAKAGGRTEHSIAGPPPAPILQGLVISHKVKGINQLAPE